MKRIIIALSLLIPSVAAAQQVIRNVDDLALRFISLGNLFTFLLVALAVIFIIWNIVMYLIRGADEEGRKAAIKNVGWGILGLFLIFSIWGLVNILRGTFRTDSGSTQIPQGQNINDGNVPKVLR